MIDRYNCESRFGDWTIDPQGEWVQYDEAQARIAELEGALREIGNIGFDTNATTDPTSDAWRRRRTSMMQDIARAALGGMICPTTPPPPKR
jgi:hypothetical protein